MYKKLTTAIISAVLILSLAACGSKTDEEVKTNTQAAVNGASTVKVENVSSEEETTAATEGKTTAAATEASSATEAITETANVTSGGVMDATDFFTDRDLAQTADTSEAQYITLSDGQDVTISSKGVYVVSGNVSNATIIVDAGDDDKVQIVLDNATITNDDSPCIYVKNADKTFVTVSGSNSLSVTGSFTSDGDTKTDAVIFSKDDITINGTGSLTIVSSDNGISGKDDLKITGGTINITASDAGIEANDSIRIAAGNITVSAGNDALHAENDDDNSTGFIYICGGTLDLKAGDDGIHATTVVQIEGGTINITAGECIEGTYIQINDGTLTMTASDDGVNAAKKSSSYTPTIEVNGGYITLTMGQGDTDGFDSNGNLYINGGTLDITAQSPFDYDGEASYTGGTIIVNGEETNQITNQFMGGGPGGGMGGGPGGRGNR